MSHAVRRGSPTIAQLYLDKVLDEIQIAKGFVPNEDGRKKINLTEIMYYCLKKNPNKLFMINGLTSEKITNEQILKRAVSLARSMIAKGLKEKTVLLLMTNHQHMVALYLALMFAGVTPFTIDPFSTVYEMTHYMSFAHPSYVFCDKWQAEAVGKALQAPAKIVPADDVESLLLFADGFSDDIDTFKITTDDPDATLIMMPTSGSTGMPKLALATHKLAIAQLPSLWVYHTKFPTPTNLVMITSTVQLTTFIVMLSTCIVYEIATVMTPKKTTVELVVDMLDKFRPTWAYLGPSFAKSLITTASTGQLSCLETLFVIAMPRPIDLMKAVKDKLSSTCKVCDGYGSTETQGYIAMPDRDDPVNAIGKVFNIFNYKIVDSNGIDLPLVGTGELYLRINSIVKGYYKNDEVYKNNITKDGWYKTGDIFYQDENSCLFYVERKRFNFNFRSNQVAPEQIEHVIGLVSGVLESVVCPTEGGPAAAVVILPGSKVSKEEIHQVVNSNLSDHKRLHGGIVFVERLPRTHSDKIHREQCKELIEKLIKEGQHL